MCSIYKSKEHFKHVENNAMKWEIKWWRKTPNRLYMLALSLFCICATICCEYHSMRNFAFACVFIRFIVGIYSKFFVHAATRSFFLYSHFTEWQKWLSFFYLILSLSLCFSISFVLALSLTNFVRSCFFSRSILFISPISAKRIYLMKWVKLA